MEEQLSSSHVLHHETQSVGCLERVLEALHTYVRVDRIIQQGGGGKFFKNGEAGNLELRGFLAAAQRTNTILQSTALSNNTKLSIMLHWKFHATPYYNVVTERSSRDTYSQEWVGGHLENSVFRQCVGNLVFGNNDILLEDLHGHYLPGSLILTHHHLPGGGGANYTRPHPPIRVLTFPNVPFPRTLRISKSSIV